MGDNSEKVALYPLTFNPILQHRIWGGRKLKTTLGKHTEEDQVGESWEISGVKDFVTTVSDGPLKGQSLTDLCARFKGELMGQKVYDAFGSDFPLLIKFIDAREDLSVQLHPNDDLAKARHNSFGKTEMWYIMEADEASRLILGFNEGVGKQDYIQHLEGGTLPEILYNEPVDSGDTFFIEVGRVHAIGSGVLLAEIQQTSDITYRLYDWDRKDSKGQSRELHTDLAMDAIDFNMPQNCKSPYTRNPNRSNPMVSCPYFTTNYIPLNGELTITNREDSFRILIVVAGEAKLYANGNSGLITYGQTILVPASLDEIILEGVGCELLEVYI